jgi:hypothetical protein
MARNYDRIPEEMRWDRQWCLAGPDDNGQYKAPYGWGPRGPFHVSPTQGDLHWRDLESCIEAAQLYKPCGIGYMLTRHDQYTCIDLDIKNKYNYPDKVDKDGKPVEWTTPEQLVRFWKIIQAFDSYTERSTSGQGFHIWVRGKIGAGCKRDGVEVYSQERFIVCTGDVVIDKDIENRQDLLDVLVAEINNGKQEKIELVDIEQSDDDETILERARNADNGDKFLKLYSGDWSGYPSQSEADLALLSIFTFYSKSNAQCRRLFRGSALGQRPKATKNDRYINDTLRLIRGREAQEEQVDAIGAAASAILMRQFEQQKISALVNQFIPKNLDLETGEVLPDHLIMDDSELPPQQLIPEDGKGLAWPPGMAGALAQYIYEGAPRPVKEVAIVSALGLLAGVCGKAFNIPQSGLNVYLVLIAKSAIGKEAMHSGIANIMSFVGESIPSAMSFVDFSDYASGPALTKAVAGNQSFVNVSGEWGRKLRRLSLEDGRDGPMQQLRTVMTNLYQKSGPKSIVGGIGYSEKEKNVASVSGVAYSMIGETTPGTYYDALTESMMEDGFLSRFTVIEYTGERPPLNKRGVRAPHPMLMDALSSLITHALGLNERFTTQAVENTLEASHLLDAFDKECDGKINSSDDEGYRQMWNRAHLKAYRIAALLAVADNHTAPLINLKHAEWALMLIRKDIGVMSRRISSGDVGVGDATRERKVLSLIHRFLKEGAPPSYQVPDGMQKEGVVPRKYLQICTQKSSSFTNHKGGQNTALESTIRALVDGGYLAEIAKDKAATKFNFTGKCYRVITLPLNSAEDKEIKQARKNS